MTASAPVLITARHTLQPPDGAKRSGTHHLGPADFLVAPFIPTQVVFVYPRGTSLSDDEAHTSSATSPVDPARLRTALISLLAYYPHLSGRLHINAGDNTCEIVDIGKGAELLEARCDTTLGSIVDNQAGREQLTLQNLPDAGNSLLPPYDFTPPALYEEPFFAVQHTTFACGSAALGMRISHAVCDGIGFFQVAKDLAEIYRRLAGGQDGSRLDIAPCIQSYLSANVGAEPSVAERENALAFEPSRYTAIAEPSTEDLARVTEEQPGSDVLPADPPAPPSVIGRYLHYTPSQIAYLKRMAVDPSEPSAWVSTFTAITAHLYRVIVQARLRLRQEDPTQAPMSTPNFLCPVDFRQCIGLPPKYSANALTHTLINPSLDLLKGGHLYDIASLIHRGISPTSPPNSADEISNTLRWIAAQPDKGKIQMKFQHGNGAVMLSAWNKMDMYEGMKFEVEPVLAGPPFTPIILIDGLGYYLPPSDAEERRKGGLVVALALGEAVWQYFDELERAFFDGIESE